MIKDTLEHDYLEGVKVYDPRDNTMKISDNPALVMADLIERGMVKRSEYNDEYWLEICNLANHCDGKSNETSNFIGK